MVRKIKEKMDYEVPGYFLQEPMEYIELICDRCGEETDDLYELGDEQLCRDCLLKLTKINI